MQIDLFKDAIIWTKTNCSACDTVKNLLLKDGYTLDIRNVEDSGTLADLVKYNPIVRTVPQVVINGRYIGGLKQVKDYLLRK